MILSPGTGGGCGLPDIPGIGGASSTTGGKIVPIVGGAFEVAPSLVCGFVGDKLGLGTNCKIVGIKSLGFGSGLGGLIPSGVGSGNPGGLGLNRGSSRFPSGGAGGG